jgi:hypothetical protein
MNCGKALFSEHFSGPSVNCGMTAPWPPNADDVAGLDKVLAGFRQGGFAQAELGRESVGDPEPRPPTLVGLEPTEQDERVALMNTLCAQQRFGWPLFC